MFCILTYSCIQFLQRMIPPVYMIYKTKPIGFSLLYKKVDCCPPFNSLKEDVAKILH